MMTEYFGIIFLLTFISNVILLKRGNYTTDTNAMAYRLFTQLAEVETYVGNASGAKLALSVATTLKERVNALLWSSSSGNVSNVSSTRLISLFGLFFIRVYD